MINVPLLESELCWLKMDSYIITLTFRVLVLLEEYGELEKITQLFILNSLGTENYYSTKAFADSYKI